MTLYTKRDRIWSAALSLAENGRFTLDDVLREADLDDRTRRTARDVLSTMVKYGHLETRREWESRDTQWCERSE